MQPDHRKPTLPSQPLPKSLLELKEPEYINVLDQKSGIVSKVTPENLGKLLGTTWSNNIYFLPGEESHFKREKDTHARDILPEKLSDDLKEFNEKTAICLSEAKELGYHVVLLPGKNLKKGLAIPYAGVFISEEKLEQMYLQCTQKHCNEQQFCSDYSASYPKPKGIMLSDEIRNYAAMFNYAPGEVALDGYYRIDKTLDAKNIASTCFSTTTLPLSSGLLIPGIILTKDMQSDKDPLELTHDYSRFYWNSHRTEPALLRKNGDLIPRQLYSRKLTKFQGIVTADGIDCKFECATDTEDLIIRFQHGRDRSEILVRAEIEYKSSKISFPVLNLRQCVGLNAQLNAANGLCSFAMLSSRWVGEQPIVLTKPIQLVSALFNDFFPLNEHDWKSNLDPKKIQTVWCKINAADHSLDLQKVKKKIEELIQSNRLDATNIKILVGADRKSGMMTLMITNPEPLIEFMIKSKAQPKIKLMHRSSECEYFSFFKKVSAAPLMPTSASSAHFSGVQASPDTSSHSLKNL